MSRALSSRPQGCCLRPKARAGLQSQQSQKRGWGCPSRDLDLIQRLPNPLRGVSKSLCLSFPSHFNRL